MNDEILLTTGKMLRRARVYVPLSSLVPILQGEHRMVGAKGARLVRIHLCSDRVIPCLGLILEHDDFNEVRDGDVIPEWQPEWEVV